MKIGDQEITREDMPAMTAWQMNPDHLRQGFQDILNAKLGTAVQMPQTSDNGMMTTAEDVDNQWR